MTAKMHENMIKLNDIVLFPTKIYNFDMKTQFACYANNVVYA